MGKEEVPGVYALTLSCQCIRDIMQALAYQCNGGSTQGRGALFDKKLQSCSLDINT